MFTLCGRVHFIFQEKGGGFVVMKRVLRIGTAPFVTILLFLFFVLVSGLLPHFIFRYLSVDHHASIIHGISMEEKQK